MRRVAVALRSPSFDGFDSFAEGDYDPMGGSIPAGHLVPLENLDGDSTGGTGATGATGAVDQTTKGTITALSDGAINNERGDLTCSISDGSPSLVGFQVGDLAGMG